MQNFDRSTTLSSVKSRSLCISESFKITNQASTNFHLKIKDAIHISWEKPSFESITSTCQSEACCIIIVQLILHLLYLNALTICLVYLTTETRLKTSNQLSCFFLIQRGLHSVEADVLFSDISLA